MKYIISFFLCFCVCISCKTSFSADITLADYWEFIFLDGRYNCCLSYIEYGVTPDNIVETKEKIRELFREASRQETVKVYRREFFYTLRDKMDFWIVKSCPEYLYDALDYLTSYIDRSRDVFFSGYNYQEKLGQKDCQDIRQKYIQRIKEWTGLEYPEAFKEIVKLMPCEE